MTLARRSSSSLSSAVAGQIGLKLYHCSGAEPIVTSSASAIACVACWIAAGSDDVTSMGSAHDSLKVSSGWRRIVTGRISEPVFAASVAGPAGRVVQASKRWTGTPSGR